jgi:TolA-binding protein
MSIPRYATLAARLLRENLQEVGFRGRAGERRRSLQTIELALNAVQRRRWYQRGAGAGLALAASLAAWVTFQELNTFGAEHGGKLQDGTLEVSVRALPLGSGATLVSASGEVALLPGTQLAVGDRVATQQYGGAVLSLSSGTHLELGADSNFVVQSENQVQRFSLDRGSVQANVATLHQGQRFIVDTPEAQVEVRGTEFRLRLLETAAVCVPPPAADAVGSADHGSEDQRSADQGSADSAEENVDETLPDGSEAAPSRVRLWVREGVVEVRSRGTITRVGAGEAWPADCLDEEAHFEQGAADGRSAEVRIADGRAADARTADARTAEDRSADARTADGQSANERGLDGQSAADGRRADEQGAALELNSGTSDLDAPNGAGLGHLPGAVRRGTIEGAESDSEAQSADAALLQDQVSQDQQLRDRGTQRGTQKSTERGARQLSSRQLNSRQRARTGSAQQELAQQELGSSANTSRTAPPKGVPSPAVSRAEAARRAEEAEREATALARNATSRGEGKSDKGTDRGSALAAQTRLFAQGVQSRQQGDSASALAAFQDLLTRYPDSALAENAIVERMRLLQARDPVAARREAERYLQRFPRGFARREAEPIAAKR